MSVNKVVDCEDVTLFASLNDHSFGLNWWPVSLSKNGH